MPSLLLQEVSPPIPLPMTSVINLWTASISAHSSGPTLLSSLTYAPLPAFLVMPAPRQQTRGAGHTHNHSRDTKEHAKSFEKERTPVNNYHPTVCCGMTSIQPHCLAPQLQRYCSSKTSGCWTVERNCLIYEVGHPKAVM